MKKLILLYLISCYASQILCQSNDNLPTATTVANASVADLNRYSAFSNPAAIANYTETNISLQYDNRFNLKFLSQKSIYTVIPSKLINIGLSASHFGYEQYNEILSGISLSRNFSQVFSMGIQYNYLSVYFAETNKRYSKFFPQIGLQIHPSSSFTIGFQTFNPMQQNIKMQYVEKRIPSVFSLGCSWKMADNLHLFLQTDKNMTGIYRFAGGFEYDIKEFLVIKTGVYNAEYLVPSLGFGLKMRSFDFHLNTELHPILGLTNSAAVSYKFHKK